MPQAFSVLLAKLRRWLLRRWLMDGNPSVSSEKLFVSPQKLPVRRAGRSVLLRSGRRELLIHSFLGLAACAIVIRLVHLQVVCHPGFMNRALRQQISEEPVLARPGDLLDRHGRLLATTIIVPSLYACPVQIEDIPHVSRLLAGALRREATEIEQRLRHHADKEFIWIQRRISEQEAAAVRALGLPKKMIGFRREFQRHYPQGTLAAHVLGIRNIDGDGRGGVEESLDEILKGKNGLRRFVRDARGYVLSVLEEVTRSPEDGTSVFLTIDVVMQMHVEEQLDRLMKQHDALGACAIVMNPQNGEILALASRPAFDPNHPESAVPAAWKNMATASVFEPGSTFKPLVVAWALDQGLIKQDDVFDCENGAYRMGQRVLHDHHHYDKLSLTDVLVKSSNIGMAKIGQRLGNEQLFELAVAFGFGRRTGIELPGELSGLLHPLEKWTSYSTGSIPMGQELAATPLQLITAHATLANRGIHVGPHLVLKRKMAGPQPRPVVISPVIGREAAEWVVQGPLVDVVKRGTGRLARLEQVDVFGKTGTAQKQSRNGEGYSSTRHLSSFVGGADAGHPQLLVLISVDEPQGNQYGGTVAAPFVAAILKRGLMVLKREAESSPVKLAIEPASDTEASLHQK